MKFITLLALFALALVGGCSSNQLTDAQLAQDCYTIVYTGTNAGLTAVLNNNPGRAAQISTDVGIATAAVRGDILNFFTNPSLGSVLNTAVDDALADLSGKLSKLPNGPLIATLIQSAMIAVETFVPLPTNPGSTLPSRTQGVIVAGLNALADGLDAAVKAYVPPAPAPTPVPPVPVTVRLHR